MPQEDPLPRPTTSAEARTYMNAWMHGYASLFPHRNFDHPIAANCNCTSATLEEPTTHSPARAKFEFVFPVEYANNPETLTVHGGAIATYFDNLTSTVMLGCVRNFWPSQGVTRNLDVTYFRSPVVGEEVVLEGTVLQCGRRACSIRGEMRRKRDGAVLAVCMHEKSRREEREKL